MTLRLSIAGFLLISPPPLTAQVPDEVSFDGGMYRTRGMYTAGSNEFFHIEYYLPDKLLPNAVKGVEFFRQNLSCDRLDQLIDLHLDGLNRYKPNGVLSVIEKSERLLVLKEVRFDGTLSGKPGFLLYFYELDGDGRTLLSAQFGFTPAPPFDTPEAFSKEFTTKEAAWAKELRSLSDTIQRSIVEEEKAKVRKENPSKPKE